MDDKTFKLGAENPEATAAFSAELVRRISESKLAKLPTQKKLAKEATALNRQWHASLDAYVAAKPGSEARKEIFAKIKEIDDAERRCRQLQLERFDLERTIEIARTMLEQVIEALNEKRS